MKHNISTTSDKEGEIPLPPSLTQAESIMAASNITTMIIKESALQLYRKALDSYIPTMLTNWYINTYQSLIEVTVTYYIDAVFEA